MQQAVAFLSQPHHRFWGNTRSDKWSGSSTDQASSNGDFQPFLLLHILIHCICCIWKLLFLISQIPYPTQYRKMNSDCTVCISMEGNHSTIVVSSKNNPVQWGSCWECLECNDLVFGFGFFVFCFLIFGAIVGWLHKSPIPSFTLQTSYCLLLLPDFVYLWSNAMCYKQPQRLKLPIHPKYKMQAAAAALICLLPAQFWRVLLEEVRKQSPQLTLSMSLCQLGHEIQLLLLGYLIDQRSGSGHQVTCRKY